MQEIQELISVVTKPPVAGAAILLGLLPGTLAVVGPTTLDMGLLTFRRPMLALLLSIGSPAISPLRGLAHISAQDVLKQPQGALRAPGPELGYSKAATLVTLQYLVVIGATVNVVQAAWDMSTIAVCTVSITTGYLPLLWCALAPAAFALGAVAVHLRFRLVQLSCDKEQRKNSRSQDGGPIFGRIVNGFARLVRPEFCLNSRYAPQSAMLVVKDETYAFIIVSWVSSMFLVGYIIIGTWFLSSMIFVFHQDAAWVAFRFLGSTMLCRAVLDMELAGMRHSVISGRSLEGEDEEGGGVRKRVADSPNRTSTLLRAKLSHWH